LLFPSLCDGVFGFLEAFLLMLGSREGVCLIHRKFLAGFLRKFLAHAGLYRGLLGFIENFLILKGLTLPMPSCWASWMVSCYASWKVCCSCWTL
jgi:hypothetical protein